MSNKAVNNSFNELIDEPVTSPPSTSFSQLATGIGTQFPEFPALPAGNHGTMPLTTTLSDHEQCNQPLGDSSGCYMLEELSEYLSTVYDGESYTQASDSKGPCQKHAAESNKDSAAVPQRNVSSDCSSVPQKLGKETGPSGN